MTQRTSTQLTNDFLEYDPNDWAENLLDSVPVLDEEWTQGSAIHMEDSQAIRFGDDRDASIAHDGTKGLDISIADADAAALDIKEGTTSYLTFVTTNSAEKISAGKDLYFGDSGGVRFGAGPDATLLHDGTTGLDLSVADNDSGAFDVKESSTSYLTVDTTNDFERVKTGKPLDTRQGIDHSTYWELFDDFNYQSGFTEADHPWVLNKGSGGTAADPAVSGSAYGVITLTTNDDDGTTAVDASGLVGATPVQAEDGNLVFETRLHIDTAITNVAVNAGFTDQTGLEEPFSISGSSYTSNAADAAVFCYDTSATTDEWHACAVDGDTDDTGCGTFGVAPAAGTYQTLRIEVGAAGGTILFFVDDTLEKTLTGGGVSPDVNLYPTVIACGDGTSVKTVDVDYVYVGVTRG
jgi:hypothetical protein